jgi:nucleoside-diphosphate-sugar epimerase
LRELLRRGQPVKMVNRSGQRPADVPASVEVVAADVYQPDQVQALTHGAAVTYLCAQPGYTEWVEKWPPLMKSVIAGVTASGSKLIFGDNLYLYGDTHGQPLHESLPATAHTRKGKVRGEVAELVLAAHRAGALRAAIGRGSDFYGPGVLSSLTGERVILPALKGQAAQLTGNIDLPHTLTYIEDFGKALVILGEREEALGQAWHVPNPPTLTQREWTTLLFEELGKPVKVSSIGKPMLTLAGLFIPAAREVVEMMYEFEKPYVVDSSKFVRAFGDHSTPHREAIKATVVWYRAYAQSHTSAKKTVTVKPAAANS